MEFEVSSEKRDKEFCFLNPGDFFRHNCYYYVVIDCEYSLNLATKKLISFASHTHVEPLEIEKIRFIKK